MDFQELLKSLQEKTSQEKFDILILFLSENNYTLTTFIINFLHFFKSNNCLISLDDAHKIALTKKFLVTAKRKEVSESFINNDSDENFIDLISALNLKDVNERYNLMRSWLETADIERDLKFRNLKLLLTKENLLGNLDVDKKYKLIEASLVKVGGHKYYEYQVEELSRLCLPNISKKQKQYLCELATQNISGTKIDFDGQLAHEAEIEFRHDTARQKAFLALGINEFFPTYSPSDFCGPVNSSSLFTRRNQKNK